MLGDFSPSVVTSVQPWREVDWPQFCCCFLCLGRFKRRRSHPCDQKVKLEKERGRPGVGRTQLQPRNLYQGQFKGWKDSARIVQGVAEEEEGLRGQGMP
jgi:hypothetical protein